ncbi:MAG: hypothetical protein ACK4KT_05070 [Thermaurantimonas sp.]
MKNFYNLKKAVPILVGLFGYGCLAQQNPHLGLGNNPNVIEPFGVPRSNILIVSKQTNQATQLRGQFQKQTDPFENGRVTLRTEGPITINVNPSTPSEDEPGAIKMSIGTNQNINWQGTLSVNIADAPEPGFSTPAKISGKYEIEYAKTLQPGEFADSTWTTYDENGYERLHGLVRQSGEDVMNLTVVSMKVDLPQIICLGALGNRMVNMAQAVYPQNFPGSAYQWNSLHPKVRITNGQNTLTPTIALLDTSIKNAQVQLIYSIGNITYTSSAIVNNCECQCQPIAGNVLVGPIEVGVNVNPVAPMPDANGHCIYQSNNANINLKMDELGGVVRMTEVQGVTLGLTRDCDSRAIVGGTFRWEGNIEMLGLEFQLPTGEKVKTFDLALKEINLAVDVNGKLSGSTKVKVTNPVDRDLTWNKGIVILRKGTNSTVTFTFSNQMNFTGSWNWSGIQNIVIDLVKKDGDQDKILANFNGNFNGSGDLSGNLTVRPDASYTTNMFKVTLDELRLGLLASINDGIFRLTSGSGKATVSDIKALKGKFVLSLNFPEAGGCNATVQADKVKAFEMELSELNVNAEFNRDFDLIKIQGSLKAKHQSFSAKVDVQTFLVEQGSLKDFRCNGDVKYSKFRFLLANAQYGDDKLNVTARVELNATGVAASAQINQFTIDLDGNIGIGGIRGNLRKGIANISIDMSFKDNGFQGTFTGDVAAMGIDGTLNYGAKEDPDYHYVYFSITAKSGVGIPIGNTGLKLTQVGGKVGYNYSFVGTGANGEPRQGTYLVGMNAGISDAADLCEVVGEIRLELSTESANITLAGNVNVLRRTPYFRGQADATYAIPANTISGSLGADLRFPMDGSVLKSNNVRISYFFGDNQFRANGNNMGGDLFNGIARLHEGYFNMNGSLSSVEDFTGRMGGRLTAQFGYNDSWLSGKVRFDAQLNVNSNFAVNINANGISGSFGLSAQGNATATVETYFFTMNCGVEVVVNGNASYHNSQLTLTGSGRLTLPYSIPLYGNVIESPEISITL